jgi:hypothetical protein
MFVSRFSGHKVAKAAAVEEELLEASMKFLPSSTSQLVVQEARTLANLVDSTVEETPAAPQE